MRPLELDPLFKLSKACPGSVRKLAEALPV
jgi:hypothetical protein